MSSLEYRTPSELMAALERRDVSGGELLDHFLKPSEWREHNRARWADFFRDVGVQVVSDYLEDRTTLDFAGRLAKLLGTAELPPPPGF